eukprot:Blabericola_migrator_1__10067@NODE_558_length_7604_cov_14_461059_g418_i0_p9_GENE_NODE_558_length_7604_cov_14_461059_g418_i0NODE_558_length_7604_cov_14_461059_g418_i0_p9_ORF_typecomplete_len106_score13_83_NODE_558_length_7604_cov_14_461059_g418_i067267043
MRLRRGRHPRLSSEGQERLKVSNYGLTKGVRNRVFQGVSNGLIEVELVEDVLISQVVFIMSQWHAEAIQLIATGLPKNGFLDDPTLLIGAVGLSKSLETLGAALC